MIRAGQEFVNRSRTSIFVESSRMLSPSEIRSKLAVTWAGVNPDWEVGHGLRDAAVVAPLLWRDGALCLVFTLRRPDLEHHAGEISFPGGRREADESPVACAVREFEEEIGVPSAALEICGALKPRTSIARYRVQPFVGLLVEAPTFVPQATEVSEVLEIPVAQLADPNLWEERDLKREGGIRYSVPFFEFQGRTLWGLTARFTLDLIARAGL